MRKYKNTGITLLLYLLSSLTAAQELRLEVIPADSSAHAEAKRLNYKKKHADAKGATLEMKRVLSYFYDKGFITASFDSIREDSSLVRGWLALGSRYDLSVIRPGNVPPLILGQSGYKERSFSGRPFSPEEISRLLGRILDYCEDHGYPFAAVKLDSIAFMNRNSIEASLDLSLNGQYTIDSILVKGNSKLRMGFIRNYLNIKQGDIYNESRIRRIGSKLQDLPFISVIRDFEIAFTDEDARIILYLDKQKASQFDGILGIAPNDDVDGKLLLTGDVKLKLLNAFKRGELIDFNWRKLESSSQDLRFHFNFPFLFNTPFGIDYRLKLFKKDTTFLNLSNNIGVQVLFNGYNNIKAFYEVQRSNLLSTAGLEFATTLPDYADITTSLYGLAVELTGLDYRFNPRKGFQFNLEGAIGTKKIRKNARVNPVLYDSLRLSSTLYRLNLDAAVFIPLFRNSTIMLGNKSGLLENESLFDNELFRIGGLKTLRGFDEESFTASVYSIGTLEFRYLFDRNSFFQVFVDGAFYERSTRSAYFSDYPFGFGAGVNFETQAGIFAFSYALGSSEGRPMRFRSAKIHFGLTARF